ncbi:MAG: 4-hydroxyphenylacetate 3-hydroxylase, partial [Actinobacteria bacterium]|nr:4-hydroxyphenylacetate 3-hydroxylase [Actinomycetota bacterium]
MRTGTDYLTGLKDDRCILLDGGRISDVTCHPTLSPAMHRIADLYDTRAKQSASWVVDDPESGSVIGFEWVVPRSSEDLALRRAAHVYWAEGSYGLMGRTPDHVASVLTGFLGSRDVFARGGDEFADNVAAFHRKARTDDLYVAYAIVPPQIDRSKPAHQQPEPFLYPGVVEERDGGIIVRGAQMIATGVVMADYLFLSYITPLQPGDEDYAISIVMPVSTPGLRIYPRRPYAATASSVFDYPLSTRLDETDSVVVLDDVLIPWDHVFVYRDVDLCRAQ